MITKIKTIHEESYANNTRTVGVLLNYTNNMDFNDSLIYSYRDGMYVFFNTINDLNDFLLYGTKNISRAYLNEEDFDTFYDNDIDDNFKSKLTWT